LEGATPNGWLAFEDMIAARPGLYMGMMGWDTYAHWTMGVVAFRMGALVVQNPSFEDPTGPLIQSSVGPWNYGPILGWYQPPATGSGLWRPAADTVSVPDGRTVLWINAGSTVLQDLGKTPAKIYKLTVSVGIRVGNPTWTISLRSGDTVLCATSGNASSTPTDSFATQTVACSVPVGDLTIHFEAKGDGQVLLDKVGLTSTEP